ncbi:hypothetical protein [Streptomyces coeruleofuscus]|uniref:Uncharacterized protein n=1 Tax=Streptomyces coeruleofuscus TaxID=66879 RepID=A0ABN3I1N9_9ACTN
MKIMNVVLLVLIIVAVAALTWTSAVLDVRRKRREVAEQQMRDLAAAQLVQRLADRLLATHGSGPAEVPVTPDEKKLWKLPSELEVTGHESPPHMAV